MSQLKQQGFITQIADVLAETGLPARVLCLELTETLFAGASLEWVRKVLNDIKSVGVSLALDDFGTGYSSMSYLQDLPFDKLKVDRAFVRGADAGESKRRLLQGIVDLGHALDMVIVAEGAEDQSEVELLRSMAADQVQGYVFGKPNPAADAAQLAIAINGRSHRAFVA